MSLRLKKRCPFCAEEIMLEAIKCKHCGEWLGEASKAPVETHEATANEEPGEQEDVTEEQTEEAEEIKDTEARETGEGTEPVIEPSTESKKTDDALDTTERKVSIKSNGEDSESPRIKLPLIVAGLAVIFVVILIISFAGNSGDRRSSQLPAPAPTQEATRNQELETGIGLIAQEKWNEAAAVLNGVRRQNEDSDVLYNYASAREQLEIGDYSKATIFAKRILIDYSGPFFEDARLLKAFLEEKPVAIMFPADKDGARIKIDSVVVEGNRIVINGSAQVPDQSIISVSLNRSFTTTPTKIHLEAYGNPSIRNDIRAEYVKVRDGKFQATFAVDNKAWWQRVQKGMNAQGKLDTVIRIADFGQILVTFTPYLDSKSGQPNQAEAAFSVFGKDFETLKDEPEVGSVRESIAAAFGGKLPDPSTPDGYYIQFQRHIVMPFDIDWRKDIPKVYSTPKATTTSQSAPTTTYQTTDKKAIYETVVRESLRGLAVDAYFNKDNDFIIVVNTNWHHLTTGEKKELKYVITQQIGQLKKDIGASRVSGHVGIFGQSGAMLDNFYAP